MSLGPEGLRWSGRQDPSSIVVEPEIDEPSQVDRGDPVGQSQLVSSDPPVADPAVAGGNQPGAGTLHHGAKLSVGTLELLGASLSSGARQQIVVEMDPHRP